MKLFCSYGRNIIFTDTFDACIGVSSFNKIPVPAFFAGITEKSLNTFYHACSYAKADYSRFMNVTSRIALHLIPEQLKSQPVYKAESCSIVEEDPNLDLIGNVRADSVIYDYAPAPTGRKGRPAKHGKCLSADDDFTLSDEKINGYYIGVSPVLTNLFDSREVLAYVTTPEKDSCTRRFFFSSIFPEQQHIFCA